jgi:hypothetical protein
MLLQYIKEVILIVYYYYYMNLSKFSVVYLYIFMTE